MNLTTKFLIFVMSIALLGFTPPDGFKSEQLKYSRVRDAYKEKSIIVNQMLNKKGIDTNSYHIFIRAFKKDDKLEIWAKNKSSTTFVHINDYKICEKSGDAGPKRQQGDSQVPEGFYHIDRFNPFSSFHLSLGLNYPNSSDKKLSKFSDLGGDIFIHGACCTIGCMPLTDDKIKEVYVFAVEAKNNGQTKIPVHIFPTILDDENLINLKNDYKDEKLISFWENIGEGYKYFQSKKTLPVVSVDSNGKYLFK